MNKTTISVVIPCRNEEKYIAKCIQSILNSTYPAELMEILVCDGMSTDRTLIIAKEFSRKNSNVRCFENKKRSTPNALNLGVVNSKGDVVIIVGAHAELYPGYIENAVEVLNEKENVGCVGGVIDNEYESSTSEIIGRAMTSTFGVGNAHFRTGKKDGYVDTVAFGAYRKRVFDKVGLFDEALTRNQDDEFNFRLLRNGEKIFLSRKLKAKYYVRGSFKKLFNQYYQYGYWKVFVNKKHRTVTTLRQLVPPLLVLFTISGLLGVFVPEYLIFFLTILLLYFIMAAYFSFIVSRKLPDFIKTVFAFLILHYGYGLGYLAGIWDFYVMRKSPAEKQEQLTR